MVINNIVIVFPAREILLNPVKKEMERHIKEAIRDMEIKE